MSIDKILFTETNDAITPDEITDKIARFGYNESVAKIIQDSKELDRDGEVFIKCAAIILPNFGMTRSGPFRGVKISASGNVAGGKILHNCWHEIGGDLIEIHNSVTESGFSRDRYLLELDQDTINELTGEIWTIFKRLLPFTMGRDSYGLTGASKLLFSVLPEIVLPIDKKQWLGLFKTVDIGDIINQMISEIKHWEKATGKKLNEMDLSKRLTTIPSVYNVMAMAARPD